MTVSYGAGPLRPLFEPIELPGGLVLPNRVAMLAMTRVRAEVDGTPNALMAEYYAQRAGAGLIITESTPVSEAGRGFLTAPGMYTTEHALGWKRVVNAVHAQGGRIVLQINHVGRANNLLHRPLPMQPVAPSAVRIPRTSRKITINIPRVTPYDRPRALETEEIPLVVDEFARAAKLAVFAGFDGVQVHADSGYLIHQFMSTNVNLRTDRYGGSPEKRARFALEVLDAVIAVNGPEFVSIKLTPGFDVHEIEETDVDEKYGYLIDELNKRKGLSFVQFYFNDLDTSPVFSKLAAQYEGVALAEGSLTPERYAQMIADGDMQMTGFGRPFIANPDYLERLANDWPLSRADPDLIYYPSAEGYTDYPRYDPAAPEATVVGVDRPVSTNTLLKAEAQAG
ncbi:alkene reductase [Dactylosporangium sucinum]|uniref:Alkene reductase n=1 Tax=Dactylosporangium sucinum TaxID=1424081 RepID=A0A917U9L2_9ACTN|nr:alkene reductase [Dactylosporangium sucinum]GGM64525.1 alkene reductase [Dactylosporangium sucinum]